MEETLNIILTKLESIEQRLSSIEVTLTMNNSNNSSHPGSNIGNHIHKNANDTKRNIKAEVEREIAEARQMMRDRMKSME